MATETHPPTTVGHDEVGHDGHGLLHHHFDDMPQQRESHTVGMWTFLVTEVMMFGGLFFVYTLYRWLFHDAFVAGSSHLDIKLGTINTFVLLFSSLTMALAVHAAQLGKRGSLVTWLMVTWVLGAGFLGIKAVEWTHDYHIGLIPAVSWNPDPELVESIGKAHGSTATSHNPEGDVTEPGTTVTGDAPNAYNNIAENKLQMFFVIYFSMTGLHAIHMIVGLLLVGYFIVMAARGVFDHGNDQPVEIVGLYWHLIDIIWVFLFPLLYLIGGFHPFGGGH